MNDEHSPEHPEDPFDGLFEGVERRPRPSEAARERAFAAVEDEWDALQSRRARRRRLVPSLAAAATLLVGLIGLVALQQPAAPTLQPQLALGHVRVGETDYRASGAPLSVEVAADAPIRALGPSRWATGGVDLRVDGGARFAWRSPDAIVLDTGRVYVATDGGAAFSVATDRGVVTDIGTRFMVERRDGLLEVAVREGMVELATPAGVRRTAPVEPGATRVLVARDGRVDERTEPATHARWNWIHTAPKGYVGRNPVAMLREIARDLGRELRFGPGVEAALQAEELDGDYRRLAPWVALGHVTAAVGAEWRDQDGVITIIF